ncbi:green algal specific Aspartyl Asparaginyl beta-hydroxylase [Raphidocelis subcapitata]|uniref:Green algal specific Aspartyl Asparaginyl beta-hydroxylase n=1 Tax=Raphidocelis subcapitata TaxID=307507 RepID=A0A2V0NZW0_9CHLO|nr:green algal specific Aspartyl Asparaginyl beta-hydroxylase [Raphidocelis subcapitata]|eukprot:GBF90355.1 green algal specific Aspartyl Asparaginyl beta-hydroxylase [Raphidocelis subcapitata]
MGTSPKSWRQGELPGHWGSGACGGASRGKGGQRRTGLTMLWLAGALAVLGLIRLESKYMLAHLTGGGAAAGGGAARAAPAVSPHALLLATHSRLVWYDPDTDESRVLHEGEGVHYGMFPGEGQPPTTVWTAVRPHNWRPTTSKEYLVEIDMRTGEEVRRVEIPARFTHDVVRAGAKVYVADTGNGAILELDFPQMTLARSMPLFTLKDHINTLAPFSPNETLVMLHNLGTSDIVRVDTTKSPPAIIGRLRGVGTKAHGIVRWHGAYVLLDSDAGALSLLRVANGTAKTTRLWAAPEPERFLKGLAVVDDVAYFGVSEFAPRSARDDPRSNCELAAFDLVNKRLLWRREVPTAGLLNIVGAPQLAEDSTYRASYSPRALKRYRTERSEAVVREALEAQEAMGYTPVVGGYWSSGQPYLDASSKSTRAPWSNGLQLPLAHFDVSEAKAFLRALDPEAWTHEYQAAHSAVMGGRDGNMNAFKPGVLGITLLFSAGSGEGAVFEFPLYEKFRAVLDPIVEEIIGKPDMKNIIRAQLALMRANVSDIRIHVDTGGYATYGHRLHIPLMTNDGVRFDLCPYKDAERTEQVCYKVPTHEGFVFELNNKVPHKVSNTGTTDRVHLVVDVAETPRERVKLQPGSTCQYDVNKGLFCGTAPGEVPVVPDAPAAPEGGAPHHGRHRGHGHGHGHGHAAQAQAPAQEREVAVAAGGDAAAAAAAALDAQKVRVLAAAAASHERRQQLRREQTGGGGGAAATRQLLAPDSGAEAAAAQQLQQRAQQQAQQLQQRAQQAAAEELRLQQQQRAVRNGDGASAAAPDF